MRVLTALSYYRPYTSGLTIHAERLAVALASRGHTVTVLTSQHDPALPLSEHRDGVEVVRVPVRARLGKGPIMPGYGTAAFRLAGRADVVHVHLPQADGPAAALAARLRGTPVIVTSHCDAVLPPGRMASLLTALSRSCDHLTAALASRVLTYTSEYAESSPFLSRWSDRVAVVAPPVTVGNSPPEEVVRLRRTWGLDGRRPVIGIATRLAAEKGISVLVDALPRVVERFPDTVVAFAGQHDGVLGEAATQRLLGPALERLVGERRWRFLGILDEQGMAAFYRAIDVLVVPSLNRTESFGLVQVEAMLAGRPVVASDLPGVRQPVRCSGMGRIVRPGDAEDLARGLIDVLNDPPTTDGVAHALEARHHPSRVAEQVEAIYRSVLAARTATRPHTPRPS